MRRELHKGENVMSEIPKPPMPWDGSCNIEPDWLNDMAEGVLRAQYLMRSLMFALLPVGFGLLAFSVLRPSRKPPFPIRVWNRLRSLFT